MVNAGTRSYSPYRNFSTMEQSLSCSSTSTKAPVPQYYDLHTVPFMNEGGPNFLQSQRLKNNGYSLRNYWSKPALTTPCSRSQRLPHKVREAELGRGGVKQVIADIWGPGHFEGICERKSMGNKTDELFLSSSEYIWCSLVMIYNNISFAPQFQKIFQSKILF